MQKFQTFFYSFKRSLADIDYYRDVLKAPFTFSLKYFYLLIFFTVFIQCVFFSISLTTLYPKIPQFTAKVKTQVKAAYPPDLEVTIKNGKVRTNVKEPYYIDIPELNKSGDFSEFQHLITIDTTASIDDFQKYKTIVLVTKNAVVYPDRQDQALSTYKVSYLTDVKDLIINKAKYDTLTQQLLPYLNYLPALLIVIIILAILVFPFIGALFVTGGHLFYLLVFAFILWIIDKIFKNNLSYKKIFQLSMHGLTIFIVITFLMSLFAVNLPFMIFTAGFLLWMVIIISKIPVTPVKG